MGNFEGGYGYDAERAVPGMPPASVKNSECLICRSARGGAGEVHDPPVGQ